MKLLKVLKIGGGGAIRAISALILLSMLAPRARAGLRPWEPSDYVQTDLVLHYDGIRNAGLDDSHSDDATIWKDLSPSGNDATLKSNGVTTYGKSGWTDNGYTFYRNAWFLTDRTQSFEGDDGDFTIQAVVDFSQSAANLVSFPMVFDSSDGTTTIQAYWNNTSGQKKAYLLADKYTGASGGNTSGRPYLTSAWAGHYLTAAFATASGGGKDAWLFEGTTYPTAHPGHVKGGSSSTAPNAQWAFGSIVSDTGRSDRLFTGKILSIRAYSHKLSEAELAWNRALDEARFYGAASVPESALCASSVPDAVIASSVAGVEGAEANGCYVVDDDGYTFRAAPFAKVGTASYVCTGYTLSKWDGAAWGAPVSHDGEFACFVAPGDKVRIEWQWAAASGAPFANPYVTDGLVLHYDGIWNAGFGVHDSAATVWKDLSASGNDAEFVYLAPGGGWLDNAYSFETNGHFQTQSAIDLGTSFTVQTVTDHSGYVHQSNTWPWFLGSADAKFSVYPNNGKPHVVLNADGVIGGSHRSEFDWTNLRYLTAMMDGTSNVLFQATTCDRAWSVGTGPTPIGAQEFTIGGPSTTASFSGSNSAEDKRKARSARTPYHAIRVYDRLLTADELAHNRAVDEARFFGAIPASNAVIVASAIAGLEGREVSGLYFPDGWAFSASTGTNTVRGIGWICAGYQMQTWDADSSTWSAQTSTESSSYTSPSGDFATVRLTWLWKPVAGIRTAADYALADYAVGGLQLHLDGLLNAGTAHDSSATVWSDLSGNGRDATLAVNGDVEYGNNRWTDDGYFFASNAVFTTANSTTGIFSLGHAYTMQVLGDVNFADNLRASNANGGAYVSPISHYTYGSIWIKSDNAGTIQHRTGDTTGAAWNMNGSVYVGTAGHVTYLSALRNGARAALVEGTAYPTTENTVANQACMDWSVGSKDVAADPTRWGVGAASLGGGAHPLWGTVKSVRLYDRMLSKEELAWNRSVDNARFFGALTTTNVVEVISGAETAYKVEGEWTFNAPTTVTIDNAEKKVAGYRLEVLDNGVWKRKPFRRGQSFRYSKDDEEVGGKTVKLIWSPEPEGLMIIIR